MILVDSRRGSKELHDALAKKAKCKLETLPSGDFAFEGCVPDGHGLIGIERKCITNDFITCMVDGRFSGYQLVEMVDYFKVIYLVIEGLFRPNKDTGALEFYSPKEQGWVTAFARNRAIMYGHVAHHINTLMLKTPIKIWRTNTAIETVELVRDLYTWHTDKTWEGHTSHLKIYDRVIPGRHVEFRKPSLRREIACKLPGIGWDRSKAVEGHFPNTRAMINATAKDWQEIDGVGKGIAEKVTKALGEE